MNLNNMSHENLEYLSKCLGIPLNKLKSIDIPKGSIVITSITDNCPSTADIDNETVDQYHYELQSVEYICPDCGESFGSADLHIEHQLSTHAKIKDVYDFTSTDSNQEISEEPDCKYFLRSKKRMKKSTLCYSVDDEFPNRKRLRSHKKTYQKRNQYRDSMSRYVTNFSEEFEEYMYKKESGPRDDLNKEIDSIEKDKVCVKSKKEKKYYHCNRCDYKAAVKSSLKNHLNLHKNRNYYICNHCGRCFKYKESLATHMKFNHSLEPQYQICQKKFGNKTSLPLHMKFHATGDCYYYCDLCKYKSKNKLQFENHKSQHLRPGLYICNHCGKSYKSKLSIENHLALYHNSEFECQICQQKLDNKSDLELHMKVHRTGIYYCCDLCNYKTAHPSHLKNHKGLHLRPEIHFCNYCGKSSKSEVSIANHLMLFHSSDNQCQICQKKLGNKSRLRFHMKLHGAGDYYYCDSCNYKTIHHSQFKNHKNQHLRPGFSFCNYCGKSFESEKWMSHHLISYHSSELSKKTRR